MRFLRLIALFLGLLPLALSAAIPESLQSYSSSGRNLRAHFSEVSEADQSQMLDQISTWEHAFRNRQLESSYPNLPQSNVDRDEWRLSFIGVVLDAVMSRHAAISNQALAILDENFASKLEQRIYNSVKGAAVKILNGQPGQVPEHLAYLFSLHALKGASANEQVLYDKFRSSDMGLPVEVRRARAVVHVLAIHRLSDEAEIAQYRFRLFQMLADADESVYLTVRWELTRSLANETEVSSVLKALSQVLSQEGQTFDTKKRAYAILNETLRQSRFGLIPDAMTEGHHDLASFLASEMESQMPVENRKAAATVARTIKITDHRLTAQLAFAVANGPDEVSNPAHGALQQGNFMEKETRLALLAPLRSPINDWTRAVALAKHVGFKLKDSPRFADVIVALIETREQIGRCTNNETERDQVLAELDTAISDYARSQKLLSTRGTVINDAEKEALRGTMVGFTQSQVPAIRQVAAVLATKLLGSTDAGIIAIAGGVEPVEEDSADETEAAPDAPVRTQAAAAYLKQIEKLESLRSRKIKSQAAFTEAESVLSLLETIYLGRVQGSPRYIGIYRKMCEILEGYHEALGQDPAEPRAGWLKQLEDRLYQLVFKSGTGALRMVSAYPRETTARSTEYTQIKGALKTLVYSSPDRVAVPAIMGLRFMSAGAGTLDGLQDRLMRESNSELVKRAIFTVLTRYQANPGRHKDRISEILEAHKSTFQGLALLTTVPVAVETEASNESPVVASSTVLPTREELPKLFKIFSHYEQIDSARTAGEYILRFARLQPIPTAHLEPVLNCIRDRKAPLTLRRQATEMFILSFPGFQDPTTLLKTTEPLLPTHVIPLLTLERVSEPDPLIKDTLEVIFKIIWRMDQNLTQQTVRADFDRSCLMEVLAAAAE